MRRTCLIANPAAGAGWSVAFERRLRSLLDDLLPNAVLWSTRHPDHARELAQRAVEQQFDLVGAVGGDGTAHEVVNGLVAAAPRSHRPAFGLVHRGTGGDLVRSLRTPRSLRAALGALGSAPIRPIDLLEVTVTPLDGGPPLRRFCVNVLGFGMNGRVVQLAERWPAWLPRRTRFVGATLRAILEYDVAAVRLELEGERAPRVWEGPLSSAFVANGGWCGGGMWVGRGGRIDDGLADVTVIPDLGRIRLVAGSPRLFSGTVSDVKGVSRWPVRALRAFAESENPVLVETDGELAGRLPATARILPRELMVTG